VISFGGGGEEIREIERFWEMIVDWRRIGIRKVDEK
jgi:hypothetical protein